MQPLAVLIWLLLRLAAFRCKSAEEARTSRALLQRRLSIMRWCRSSLAGILVLAGTACSSITLPNINLNPLATRLELNPMSDREPLSPGPAPASELVDAEGRCPAPPTEGPTLGGIALGMTECEVVRRAGAPSRVEIADEHGERTVMLTYLAGERAGIYRFVSGRLVTMERTPEPTTPERPTRQKRARK